MKNNFCPNCGSPIPKDAAPSASKPRRGLLIVAALLIAALAVGNVLQYLSALQSAEELEELEKKNSRLKDEVEELSPAAETLALLEESAALAPLEQNPDLFLLRGNVQIMYIENANPVWLVSTKGDSFSVSFSDDSLEQINDFMQWTPEQHQFLVKATEPGVFRMTIRNEDSGEEISATVICIHMVSPAVKPPTPGGSGD